ncbi:helix-turn-helix domain-containing protein [Apilactobacillus timberlakei]|uniref:XRE family transcriptional regulator n=1 Tax=Apilactobacillus timberlakei TaxID=2008380 RepID=A0ABY2YRM2_9LACO|nr:helix-turn-helix transcriptional regulator [Apilactobacillus timberlakei]TPR12417.1 XRE family transcriptional regulator [Apilactobacillus timberlakei]TPR12957.1 XRE family transcriptional regulator [Apilactobacillus timberlakei]
MCSIKERPYYKLMMILKKKNVTQAELSRKTGISRNNISLKIRGKHAFRYREMQKIAKILNVSQDDID